MPRVHLVPFLLATLTLLAAPAFAYGPPGTIWSAPSLTGGSPDPGGPKVKDLLDGLTLEKVAVIPDEIKGWDKNGPDDPSIFHYSAHPRIDARSVPLEGQSADPRQIPDPSHHWFHYADVPVLDAKNTRTAKWDVANGTSST